MKIIISHDVDHITAIEHKKDLIIPKHLIRSFIELGLGYISLSELNLRLKSIIKNKWHNLEALIEFDKDHEIPSTFFLGVEHGKGLCYSKADAEYWIQKLMGTGFGVGMHGIAFDDPQNIRKECETFKKIAGAESFGIRIHYLRNTSSTLDYLNQAGYLFDSSIDKMINPFKVGNMWEFPLHIMDGRVICKNGRWQNQNLDQAMETAKKILEKGFETGIKYFSILFHDFYFSDQFKTSKEWYIWLIRYLKDVQFKFMSYSQAIGELENGSDNGNVSIKEIVHNNRTAAL